MAKDDKVKRRIKWYRSPIDPADLARLNQRSNWRGLLQTIGFLAVLVCSGGLAWFAIGRALWLVVIALIYLHGALYAFLVNGFYELCHKSVFKTQALNRIFRDIYSFLGWYNHVSFWASHQAHHRYTLHPPDDLEVVLPVELTLRSYLGFAFINPRGFYRRMKNILLLCFGIIENDWKRILFPPELHNLVKDDTPVPCQGVIGTWRQVIPILRRQQREPE